MRCAGFLLLLLIPVTAPARSNPWGERFRNLASGTSIAEEGTCETCGRPTLFGRRRCFHCLRQAAPHEFREWSRQALERSRDAFEQLRQQGISDELIRRLEEARDLFRDGQQQNRDLHREMQRQYLENLGQTDLGNGRRLNDLARETVVKLLPALDGTDIAADPAKTLSYFLILDGKGFIEQVKLLRGPFGEPLTLLEAYELYRHTSPDKAREILEILDGVRRLSTPGSSGNDQLSTLLDLLARNLRLLQRQSPPAK